MPTKTTKKTSNVNSKKKVDSSKSSVKVEKKDSTKKVVVKRRKLDLTPTRASAVAIASQANREKKKALIEKLAAEEKVSVKYDKSSSKIPGWVWVFFGCSLLLFCVSFYQAIIRPQLEQELTEANSKNSIDVVDSNNSVSLGGGGVGDRNENVVDEMSEVSEGVFLPSVPKTAIETIEEYFRRLSAKEFDSSYDLFTPGLQRSSEIREHFTSFRMNPFISGIEGKLVPTNFQYVNTTSYGKDRYSFDLSYTLSSNQEKYDETREFVVDTSGDEPKIASIVCTTTKCSRHPIFWPESYDLMR